MDSLHDMVMRIGGVDLDEDVSVADNDRTAASPRYIVKRDLSCSERIYTLVHPLVVDVWCVLFWDNAHWLDQKQNTPNIYHKQMTDGVQR